MRNKQKEADPLVQPEEKRNYAKARKFAKMLKKGQLPEEIKLMYTEAAQKSNSPRLFKTELINRLFQQNKSGEWVMTALSLPAGSSLLTKKTQLPKVLGWHPW